MNLPAPAVALPTASRRDWQEALALLDTALDLDTGSHAGWLAGLGPEQARLAPWLESLLRSHASRDTGDFMQTPAISALAHEPQTAPPGSEGVVGPYRLLREIGQGGMATVWLAERADGLLDRQIALKLPHMSWGGARFADRMARERNILASLAHPNIARLYDAGIAADGRPFLALEYVAGVPIDAYVRAHRLGLRERVGLIVQVARAVAHAHAHLVVHRDLKPSNILVDAQGQAHLLDFGIAKLIGPQLGADGADAQLTQAPARALTPDYASPEQIRGDAIGTASDVYSLGVVLFDLLAGERPHRLKKGLNAAALAEAIERADAPRASAAAADPAVRRQLKGDLDAILARAIAKASAKRYATVDALADDLERHLRGEPVRARPDSHCYLADRWVRRHKLETAIGAAIVIAVPAGAVAQAAVLMAIAAGAGVALWQARVARQQTKIAKEEAARAAAVKAFLTSFFKSGSLEEDGGARLGQLSVQEFVERGARKIDLGFEHESALKNELLDVVSTLFVDLSDGVQTVEYARKWQLSLERFGATDPEWARAAQRLAQGLALLGRNAEAAGVVTQALARLRPHQDVLHSTLLAHLLVDLAGLQGELGDAPSALAAVDEALGLLGSPAGGDTAAAAAHGAALYMRADLLATSNRLAESEFRHALRLFRDTGGEADLNAAIVESYLGRMLSFMHDRHEARAEGLRLLAHARDVFGRRADSVSPHYSAQVNLYLAEALIDDGELVLAREPIQACVAFFGDSVESPLQRSVAQVIHGRFLTECGEYDAATHVLEAARTERLRAIGPDHPQTAAVTYRIGLVHLRDNDFARARAVFESILRTEDHGEAVWATLKQLVRMSLALTQLEQGDVAQAIPALQASFDHYCANTESARYSISEAEVSLNLGRALLLSGEARRALPLLQRAADAMAMNHPKSPGLASNRSWLGLCCLALGDAPQARALADLARAALHAQSSAGIHYRRSLALLTERLGTDPAPR